jgi:AcrR family transcriptional regulator
MANSKRSQAEKTRRPKLRAAAEERGSADPRSSIMDAAERLCAEHGLEAVSVRDIVAEAKVNLAAINYYFGSRNKLLVAILERSSAEIEAERGRLLGQAAKKQPPDAREIVRAMMTPLAHWRAPDSPRRHALQFLSRALIASIPELKQMADRGVANFRDVIDLLARALPNLSRDEICWRFHFMMSIEHMNQWDTERLQILSNGRCGGKDVEEDLERAIDFVMAGFLAPPRLMQRSSSD